VSSPEHRENEERQAARLTDSCAVLGYQVAQVMNKVATGGEDSRPTLWALLTDTSVTCIVVEHRGRRTRLGFASTNPPHVTPHVTPLQRQWSGGLSRLWRLLLLSLI
jgi:predicted site-specific integrase-resolvase